MDPSGQSAVVPPTQSELGAPSASQLGKSQGAPPDQEEIGTSSHCRRLAWIEKEFGLQNNPNLRDPVDLKKAQLLLLAYWDVLSKEGEYGQTSLIEHEIKTTRQDQEQDPSNQPNLRSRPPQANRQMAVRGRY
jgi:hypothetical protein